MSTPEEIIGIENYDLLVKHFKAVHRCSTQEQHNHAVQQLGLTATQVKKVGQLYAQLREAGYWPKSLTKMGNILWGVSRPPVLRPKDTTQW
jgi:hypothetical protein